MRVPVIGAQVVGNTRLKIDNYWSYEERSAQEEYDEGVKGSRVTLCTPCMLTEGDTMVKLRRFVKGPGPVSEVGFA